ncbi:nuclear transport factor 2 family protein [Arthrobacter sp. NPDC080031]|uniref:nuclear transport factor 2 family protein n=1 Tax=Arthrobacter sp. NPDC080031 TaxID=3155918 RepID=UPI00344BF47D
MQPRNAPTTDIATSSYDSVSRLITDLHTAMEAGDTEKLEFSFTPDAEASFSHLGQFRGASSIASALTRMAPPLHIVRYRITNPYIALEQDHGQQSAYLLGTLATPNVDGSLNAFLFGGHYIVTYALTKDGWRITRLSFTLDWHHGNADHVPAWSLESASSGGPSEPLIVSELDAPWRAVPSPDAGKSPEQLVSEAYIRYAWGLDQADFELMASAFTDDARADMVPFGNMEGRREIIGSLKALRIGQPYMQHAASNFTVDIQGTNATMDIYRVVPFMPTLETLDAPIFGARYESRLRLEDGVWKFEWLRYFPGWTNTARENVSQ